MSDVIREIPRVQPSVSVINSLPPPVVSVIDARRPPVTNVVPPPVTEGLEVPVVNVPDTTIDYPVIDVPTQEEWEGVIEERNGGGEEVQGDTRDLPDPKPIINVAGLDVPLPEVAPLITAGATAVITTAVTLGATIVMGQVKTAAEPFLKQMLKPKKKKVKIKQVKPVLHFIPNDDGTTEIIEYSAKGMKVLEGHIEKLEQYLRDQIDTDSFWEYDNKIIIDEELKSQLTKEGVKRFKKYFQPPKVIAKKLGAKFSI